MRDLYSEEQIAASAAGPTSKMVHSSGKEFNNVAWRENYLPI